MVFVLIPPHVLIVFSFFAPVRLSELDFLFYLTGVLLVPDQRDLV